MDTSGIVHAKYVSNPEDFDDVFGADEDSLQFSASMRNPDDSPLSPDTNEFLVLEQQVLLEEQKDQFEETPSRNSMVTRTPSTASSSDYQNPSVIIRYFN